MTTVADGEAFGAELVERDRSSARDGGVVRAKDRPAVGELVATEHASIGGAAHRARTVGDVPAARALVAGEALAATRLRRRSTAVDAVARGTSHVTRRTATTTIRANSRRRATR
jgi:hypothetical protein